MDYSDEEPPARVVYESGSDSEGGQDSDQDDDPIIRRLPVYYTPHYLNSLTLLQYPDRLPRPHTPHPLLPPSLRPDDDQAPLKPNQQLHVKHKPNTQHISLSLPIERHEERWNEEEAEAFAKGVEDEATAAEDKKAKKRRGEDEEARRQAERDNRRLDRMNMSSITVPDVTNYLVGVLKDGKSTLRSPLRTVANGYYVTDRPRVKLTHLSSCPPDALHLHPITQTYQLRPSLNYLDNLEALARRQKREAAANADDSDVEVSDTELRAETAKAVQVSVKQAAEGGTAAAKAAAGGMGFNGRAGAGLFAPMRAMEGEPWKALKHFHADVSWRARDGENKGHVC